MTRRVRSHASAHVARSARSAWPALAVAGTCALAAWAAVEWKRLKRTPALSEASANAGITARTTQAGPYRMFSRQARHEGRASRVPVVLVHGLVISSRYMEPLALALRDAIDGLDVHAPDLPGFGESPTRQRALTVPELADALRLWLAARGIDKAVFIGNSFGCQILAEFAARFPGCVDKLVLQGPTVDRAARFLPAQMLRDWRNGRLERARSAAALGRIDYAKAGLLRAFATMRELVRDRIEDKLSRVHAPTLVVVGSRDPVVPLAWAREVTERLPHGELLVIEGGTHTLNYVYPHSMALAIRPFLLDGVDGVDGDNGAARA
ncbi:alpha/beta fold hydrolase [Caballeronia sp. BCC1704]|uniref:alpha/beta fold hydrolase n=1 Tax=Caballeronia sp. BCC1704 TaxID=2676300 RepID=UPI00158852B9|nr:alpha/beta fold hydrolase [Caballeronia sp. BCC1704]